MMSTQAVPFLTPEQYLEMERSAETRSEYLNGAMYAMSGSTITHAFIVNSALLLLGGQLRGRKCAAFATDLRLFVRERQLITYPDIFVACEPYQDLDGRKDMLVDAVLIIEVLSPSSKNYDRGEKFLFYRSLPSFREYLLLAQDQIHAEHHVRQSDGSWVMREYSSAADEIALPSIECRLRLEDVYERVEFETASELASPV
jgi:Uma2 family endonuclease